MGRIWYKKIVVSGTNSWSIEVSERNSLTTNFYDVIFDRVSPIVDFDEVIQWNLALNSILRETDFRIIAVSKDEINTLSFDTINEFIERLSANRELLIKSANSLDVFFFQSINKDTREIFQIPEVMKWLKHSIDRGIPWFYFLSTKNKNNGLHLLIHSYCSNTNVDFDGKGYIINYSPEYLGKFVEKNFDNLTHFMEIHHLEIELNIKISERVTNYFLKYLT